MNAVAIIDELKALAADLIEERDACAGMVAAQIELIKRDRWKPETGGELWLRTQQMPAIARDHYGSLADRILSLVAQVRVDTADDDAREIERLREIIRNIRGHANRL